MSQLERRQSAASLISTIKFDQQLTLTTVLAVGFTNAQFRTKDDGNLFHTDPQKQQTEHYGDSTLTDCTRHIQRPQQTNTKCHHQNTPSPHKLPNEIMMLIFQHFSHSHQGTLFECTLVCKTFYMIVHPLLWQAPSIVYWNVSSRFLTCVAKMPQHRLEHVGQYIRTLHLNGPLWTPTHLQRLLPNIPHLTHLSIASALRADPDTNFQIIPRYCRHLTSLKLIYTHLTESAFSAIAGNCHRLRSLEWKLSQNQVPEWLEQLTSSPLEQLNIDSNYVTLNDTAMTIIRRFRQLTCLSISQGSRGQITPLLLQLAPSPPLSAMTWPALKQLILSPCMDLDDATLVGFIKMHPQLQYLELRRAERLTDASLDGIALWLPRLVRLAIDGSGNISSAGVRRLVHTTSSNNLMSLKFLFCRQLMAHDFPTGSAGSATAYNVVDLDQNTIEKIKQAIQKDGYHGPTFG